MGPGARQKQELAFKHGLQLSADRPAARAGRLEAAPRPLVEWAPGLSLAEEPRRNRAFVNSSLEGLQLRATG
jgi:hypothetical protein